MKNKKILTLMVMAFVFSICAINVHLNLEQESPRFKTKNVEVLAQTLDELEKLDRLSCICLGTLICPGDYSTKVKFIIE